MQTSPDIIFLPESDTTSPPSHWLRNTCLGLAGIAIGGIYLYTHRSWLRQLFQGLVFVPARPTSNIRGAMLDLPLNEMEQPTNVTHSAVAAVRNTAMQHMVNMAQSVGLRPFVMQKSIADTRRGYAGSHYWHWVKDTPVPMSDDQPEPTDAVILSMTDFHADMNELLSEYNHNVFLLYTITPEHAGATRAEYSYCFTEHGKIHWHVSGGSDFEHPLWTYGTDTVGTTPNAWRHTPSAFLVERRYLAADTSIILLLPLCKMRAFLTILPTSVVRWLWSFIEVPTLQRFDPIQDGYVRFRVNTPNGLKVTTAQVGSFDATTVSAEVDSQIAAYASVSKQHVSNTGVLSYAPELTRQQTIHLTAYHMVMRARKEPTMVVSIQPPFAPVVRYQVGPIVDETAKPAATILCNPIVAGLAYAPDICDANTAGAIIERQLRPSAGNNRQATNFMRTCMAEFLVEVSRRTGWERGSVDMTTIDRLKEVQSRPTQIMQLDQAAVTGSYVSDRPAGAFPKKEVYPAEKAPRTIVTFDSHDKLDLGLFLNALAVVLKDLPNYLFVAPTEQMRRIAELCGGEFDRYETDFDKMDARVWECMRELEQEFALFFLCMTLHEQYLACAKADSHKLIYAGDLRFRTKSQRLSGSAGTSLFNTLINLFWQYFAARLKCDGRADLTPSEAFDTIGVAGGDDGLIRANPLVPQEQYQRAAKAIGQVVKFDVRPAGQPCKLLGRWFGQLNEHDANSCADLKRTLAKFHLTFGLCDNVVRLREKASAYLLTDGNTPVLGPLCRMIVESEGPTGPTQEWGFLARRCAEYGDQPKNEHNEWMDEVLSNELPGFRWDRFNALLAGKMPSLLDPAREPCWTPDVINEPLPGDAIIHKPLYTAEEAAVLAPPGVRLPAIYDGEPVPDIVMRNLNGSGGVKPGREDGGVG